LIVAKILPCIKERLEVVDNTFPLPWREGIKGRGKDIEKIPPLGKGGTKGGF
jgi:hypothetical protein